MPNFLIVAGTRPEAIKLAPVIRELRKVSGGETRVCVTGQHREMLDRVLRDFGIRPDFDLAVMRPGQSLSDLTARVLSAVSRVYERWRPDVVFVQGDTTTALAAALAGFYGKIPVAHVEAGLRSSDPQAPWPEEMNRKLMTSLTRWHFATTEGARANLLREGVRSDDILVTGSTVIDALLETKRMVDTNPPGFPYLRSDLRTVLVTCHRRENFGAGLRNVCDALGELARRPDVQIVYPVHLNPRVREPARRLGGIDRLHLVEPLDYPRFVSLMGRSDLILTDSGGIQEEAPALGKPVLVMRETTERPEAVEAGTARLVGTDRAAIVREVGRLLDDPAIYRAMARTHNPYGDGRAAARIREFMEKGAGS